MKTEMGMMGMMGMMVLVAVARVMPMLTRHVTLALMLDWRLRRRASAHANSFVHWN